MTKIGRTLLIAMVLVLSMHIPASANIQDNLVPQDREGSTVGEVELTYNEYPQHHYKLDTYVDTSGDWLPWNWAEGIGNELYVALMEMVNAMWQMNVLLANFTMLIVQEAFELDFVSGVVDEIGAAIQNIAGFGQGGFMGNGLWPLLITFIICLVGAWAAYVGMVKRESSRAWGGLISSLIVFVFSLGFFSNASQILGGVNQWSSDLQGNILAVTANIVTPGASYSKDEGIASIRNQMHEIMVQKPYLLMQYGTTDVESDRVNDLLSIDPIADAEDRQGVAMIEVEDQNNTMMSTSGVSDRAAFVPLLFLGNSIIGIFLLLISGSIILYQIIFMVLALFAPVPLLMALVPRWQQTAVEWASKLIHAQLMKIAIALLLTILFGVSAILYRAADGTDLGYVGMMVLQIICFVGIWAKRKDLFSMVSTASNNIQSSTGQTLQNYRMRYNNARNNVRQGQNFLTNRNSSMRDQPLANRQVANDSVNQETQGVNKKKGKNQKISHAKADATNIALMNRGQEEEAKVKAQEDNAKKVQNRANVENAPTTDSEKLMDRKREDGKDTERTDEKKEAPSNVTHINSLRERRMGKGELAKAPLAERETFKNDLNDTVRDLEQHSKEHPNSKDHESINQQQSERNINMVNRQDHQDKINEKQTNNLAERRTLEKDVDRDISTDSSNREQTNESTNQTNLVDRTTRNVTTNEGQEKHSNETVNRNNVSNENTERTVNHVTERNHNKTENNRNVQDSFTETENVSRDITKRREQNVKENVNTINNVNREERNETTNRNNVKKSDKTNDVNQRRG
ncbi:CD3337/EF1877 family mobilome membrane protein [Jeotgalibacillus proteolyticus]|uniref:CD3337/EF1877 family mobilome membrane protein n=1 Tax=Jeotgalibacillus proteolyticus TaxID=2082395 RepID=UPI001ADA382B|nr:conjugal transfer protein [Jeotgalibacillus proteolyticus]